jgi:MarR family transcriptional regulator, organic hydroperoxide resistance regulator
MKVGLWMSSCSAMEQTISYLIAQICKVHRNQAEALLSDIGLHTGQELFLMRLWEEEGLSQSQLADSMCVQPATMTKMLQRMETVGLIERRPDQEDSRVSRVYLTDQSRQLRQQVEQVWSELEERTTANFSVEERVLLRRLLLQIQQNLVTGS